MQRGELMQYRILSEEMQDREVKVLMSMLVPGSVVQRIERLHDVNGIDVYFKRGVSDVYKRQIWAHPIVKQAAINVYGIIDIHGQHTGRGPCIYDPGVNRIVARCV